MSALAGVLPMLKPPGPTSAQFVAAVRRRLGPHVRVGHAGTLDPGAAGVLPLCLGRATRLAEYLQLPLKGYRFELILGADTDTQDAEGRVLSQRSAACVERQALEAVLASLVGQGTQQVPLYSARRVDGRRLYSYARSGQPVQAPEGPVRIAALRLLAWSPGERARALCDVRCGSGTYVRALCARIGGLLEVGGHMGHLIRYSAGGLQSDTCLSLEEWEAAPDAGLERLCLEPATALAFLPALTLDVAEADGVRYGRPPGPRRSSDAPGLLRLLDAAGRLLAVGRCTVEDGVATFTLEKVLAQ